MSARKLSLYRYHDTATPPPGPFSALPASLLLLLLLLPLLRFGRLRRWDAPVLPFCSASSSPTSSSSAAAAAGMPTVGLGLAPI